MRFSLHLLLVIFFISASARAGQKTNLWCENILNELQNISALVLSEQALEARAQDQVAAAELAQLFPKIKSKHRDRQRGYASLNFPPEIKSVPQEILRDATTRIKNQEGATAFDELAVLDQVGFQTRRFLVKKLGGAPRFPLGPDLVRDWCFESTRFVRHRLSEIDDELNMKVAFHDLRAFTGEYWPHYVTVVQFASGRTYWLDFTWAQFDGSSNEYSQVGKTLRESGALGTLMANLLNAKGILPLSATTAQLLLHSYQMATPNSAVATLNARTAPVSRENLLNNTADMSRH